MFEQFCPIALSLDAIGDRRAVLLLRDLLWSGPQTTVGLLERNPGLDPADLEAMLIHLTDYGLVERMDEPKARHRLTERGHGIAGVINALFEFGLPLLHGVEVNDWILSYAITDCARRRRLDLLEVQERHVIRLVVDRADVIVELSPGLLRLLDGHTPCATVEMSGAALAELLAAERPPAAMRADGTIRVSGDDGAARALIDILPADH